MRSGDVAWGMLIAGVLVYEVIADDLMTYAVERYRNKHPLLVRFAIAAVAGHLAGVLDPRFDLISRHNPIHRTAINMLSRAVKTADL